MKVLFILLIMLLTTGCSSEDTNSDTTDTFESFSYRGVVIEMHAEADSIVQALEELNEPVSYFEMESCAFQGLDKIYTYNSFELYTYPVDGKDFVMSIVFKDDDISTPEGISLNSSLDDILSKYGENYDELFGVYTYTLNNTLLSFMIEDDKAVSIEYIAVSE